MLIRPKWYVTQRIFTIGDIVLVQDANAIRGHWKIAEVCEIIPSSDSKVRDVKIRYNNPSGGVSYKGCKYTVVARSVHRLVLLIPIEEQ